MSQSIATTLDARSAAQGNGAVANEAQGSAVCVAGRLDTQLEVYRGALTQFAAWLLGNREVAQYVVQETLAFAAGAPQMPDDPALRRPWLFARLKHRVIEVLRRQSRVAPMHDDSAEDGGIGDPAFLPDGHWCNEPTAWGDVDATLAQAGFMRLLEGCIDRLPQNTARVFTLREILGMDTQEICATVGISKESCAAMLCRARLAVRDGLEREWFAVRKVQ